MCDSISDLSAAIFGYVYGDGAELLRSAQEYAIGAYSVPDYLTERDDNRVWRVYECREALAALPDLDWRDGYHVVLWPLGTGYVSDVSVEAPLAWSDVKSRTSYWFAGAVSQGEWETDCPECGGEERECRCPRNKRCECRCARCEGLGVVDLEAHAIQAYRERPVYSGGYYQGPPAGRGPSARNARRRWRDAVEAHRRAYAWHYRD